MLSLQRMSGSPLIHSVLVLVSMVARSVAASQVVPNADEPILVEVDTDGGAVQGQPPIETELVADSLPLPDLNVRVYHCVRLPAFARQGTIQIDGRLSESVWDLAPWSEEFVDIEGVSKPRPIYRTRMKMLWDAQALYIAAELQEPDVRGALTSRDSIIFKDNDFEVFIDPEGDGLNYGELEINALNTIWDLRLPRPYSEGGQPDDGWTLQGLRSAVRVEGTLNDSSTADRSWSLELAIPWQGLRSLQDSNQPVRRAVREGVRVRGYEIVVDEAVTTTVSPATAAPIRTMPPAEGDVWRMNFSRVEWPSAATGATDGQSEQLGEENWVWSPQGVIDMHRPERWGRVIFSGPPEMENSGRGPTRIIRR